MRLINIFHSRRELISVNINMFAFPILSRPCDGTGIPEIIPWCSLTILACVSNSMKTSLCCNLITGYQIPIKFCTCHNTAVVSCAKDCRVYPGKNQMRAKQKSIGMWNCEGKPSVKWVPNYPTQSTSWLLMTWRHEPWYQQPCIGIFRTQHQNA